MAIESEKLKPDFLAVGNKVGRQQRFGMWVWALMALGIAALAGVIEVGMGRTIFSASGVVRIWVGDINSSECSQQILDWYSFSHLLHGFLFYAILRGLNWLVSRKRWSPELVFILAVAAEAGWELLENSPIIIERYRQGTIALGYTGDSVLNSMSDIVCCAIGCMLARRLPVWMSVVLFIVVEVALAILIRDNLTLNVIMLIHPVEAIKQWQLR